MTAEGSDDVRPALAADVARLIEIRAAVAENRLTDPASIGAADYVGFIAGGRCWVWEHGGAIAGFAAIDADAASVWALFVAPEAERRGGGRRLHDRMIAEARRLGLAGLELETEAGSRAEAFYSSAGWTIVVRREDGMLRMRLALQPACPKQRRR